MRYPAVLLLSVVLLAACTSPRAAQAPIAPPPPADPAPAPASDDPPPLPAGQKSGWKLVFSDEFEGTTLDTGRWRDHSSAEPDLGRGNLGNQQLEWNRRPTARWPGAR